MPDDGIRSDSANGVLESIFKFAEESEEDVETMSADDIQQYLRDEGIDLAAKKRELQFKLKQIKGKLELETARNQRLGLREALERWTTDHIEVGEQLRTKLAAKLGLLGATQPDTAMAYFRRLDQASDEDVQRMLEDLEHLEEINETMGDGA